MTTLRFITPKESAMTEDRRAWVERFRQLRILVIGDSMLDRFVDGVCTRLCPEGPVPVVTVASASAVVGGAANTAMNASSLGAEVHFLSVTGNDDAGSQIQCLLHSSGISCEHVLVENGRRTLVKERVLAGTQLLLRLDHGNEAPLEGDTEKRLELGLTRLFPTCDALIISDYGYGVLTPKIIQTIAELQARTPRVIVIDSKRLPDFRIIRPTAVKPNYQQAIQLLNGKATKATGTRAEQIHASGPQILGITGARIAAVTLDAEGALIFERDRPPYRTYASSAHSAHVAGAGDTFTSTLALALAAGADSSAAADLASAAAGVVVNKEGIATCTAAELCAHLSACQKSATSLAILQHQLDCYRRTGRRIVLTNGCFDILHRGHVTYLAQARSLGDVLVVGINSDESIRRLKGSGQPVNSLEDRLHVLAVLQCVDHLISFDEDTPHNLIRAIRPDAFVKGGDYTRDRLPEASLVEELGGSVRILPIVENRSTTRLLTRIRDAHPNRKKRRDALQLTNSARRDDGLQERLEDSNLSPSSSVLNPPSEGDNALAGSVHDEGAAS
jgi:D-beta-D-heptose 7-phosphate kinase/D-beta-D-heptose 1-phosphate adenosyltransferase